MMEIYAELLSNIRQVSLAVSLSTPSDASTRVMVAADGKQVQLSHHGEARQLELPAKIVLGAASLTIQKRGVTALSWRLPLDAHVLTQIPPSHQATSLWSATDLDSGAGVHCRKCDTTIVGPNSVMWKDLPSENWAEMMEFWHCHKPNEHSHNYKDAAGKADEASLAARGYGASSTISAQKSIGFVDLTTLLFAESDCHDLTFSPSTIEQGSPKTQDLTDTEARSLNVFCSSCSTQLGFFNFRTSAVILLKWQVSCKSVSGTLPGVPECLAASLISTISRSGSSKSLITPMDGNSAMKTTGQVIHIWVLNSGIVYSSSAVGQSTLAIKLLYRLISQGQAEKILEDINCDAQELSLPATAIEEVVRHLDESNLLLPGSERSLKDWKVGLLKR